MQLFDHLVVAYFFGPPCIITTGDRFSTFSELEAYLRLMARFGWQWITYSWQGIPGDQLLVPGRWYRM